MISMLPASRHVESLYLGEDGLLSKITPGTLIIDSSTIAPESTRKVAEAAKALGLSMIDAPVSGGVAGALGGTLTFIVGGSDTALTQARPLLEAMGGENLQQHATLCADVRDRRGPATRCQ